MAMMKESRVHMLACASNRRSRKAMVALSLAPTFLVISTSVMLREQEKDVRKRRTRQ
jgi:hypothetical protein